MAKYDHSVIQVWETHSKLVAYQGRDIQSRGYPCTEAQHLPQLAICVNYKLELCTVDRGCCIFNAKRVEKNSSMINSHVDSH